MLIIPAFAPRAGMATAPRTRPLFTRTRLVDRQGSTIHRFAVQPLDGGIRAFLGFHGDEAEASRPAAESVQNQIHFNDVAESGESVLKLAFSCAVGKIPDEQFRIHYDFALTDRRSSTVPDRRALNHQ